MSDEPVSDEPVFPVGSALWEVCRERCVLLYGPAAAILQVAHPRVAQGVAEHSRFRDDTLGRLRRTLSSVNRISFGTRAEAEIMRRRLASLHGDVKGVSAAGVSGPRHYSAFEPELLMWVLATLIWGAIQGREAIYGPLSRATKEAFFADMRRFGGYFGLPERTGPQNWLSFESYFESMLAAPWLGDHELCREVAAAVVHPQDNWLSRVIGRGTDFLPSETLPSPVRERLGLRSTAWSRRRKRLFDTAFPPVFRALPASLRLFPEARRAWRRHQQR